MKYFYVSSLIIFVFLMIRFLGGIVFISSSYLERNFHDETFTINGNEINLFFKYVQPSLENNEEYCYNFFGILKIVKDNGYYDINVSGSSRSSLISQVRFIFVNSEMEEKKSVETNFIARDFFSENYELFLTRKVKLLENFFILNHEKIDLKIEFIDQNGFIVNKDFDLRIPKRKNVYAFSIGSLWE